MKNNATSNDKQSVLSKRHIMILVALFVCLLWGSAFPSVAASYRLMNVYVDDVFQVMLFAGMRFLISASLIFAYAFATGKSMRLSRHGFKLILVLGLLQTFGQYIFFFLSLRTVHPANASILSSLGVFMTVTIAHFVYKTDRLTPKKIWGLAIGIIGIIILSGGIAGSFSWVGEGFMFTSSLLGAIAGIYTKKLTTMLSPYVISGYQLLFGSLLLIILGLTFSQDVAFAFTVPSTTLLLYLGFISAAAFTLWSALLKHNQVSKVSIYKFSIPVFGVFLSFVFLQEAFDLVSVMVAMILVAIGILLINLD